MLGIHSLVSVVSTPSPLQVRQVALDRGLIPRREAHYNIGRTLRQVLLFSFQYYFPPLRPSRRTRSSNSFVQRRVKQVAFSNVDRYDTNVDRYDSNAFNA